VINQESKKNILLLFLRTIEEDKEKWLTFINEKTAEHVRLHLIPIED